MAKLENITETLGTAQSINFVETFGKNLKGLLEMLGVERKLVMPVGAKINTYKSKVTLQEGTVDKGDIIPLSKVELTPGDPVELKWLKHRKAVAVEDIQAYGYETAIQITDDKMVKELQKNLRSAFFAQLKTGTGTATGAGLQAALAQGWGQVQKTFEDDAVMTIAFVNPLDIADYLAKAAITVQDSFGMKYVENFLGVDVVVISTGVEAKTAYVTAAENLVFAYAKVDGGEINKAFDFITDSTNVIGVTHAIDKTRLTAETTTLSGTALFAEVLDGVVKVTITAGVAA